MNYISSYKIFLYIYYYDTGCVVADIFKMLQMSRRELTFYDVVIIIVGG